MNVRGILLIFFGIMLLALSGCINENRIAPVSKESIQSSGFTDLDGDGIWDYGVYEFSQTSADGSVKIKRRLVVSAITASEYDSFNFLTDLNLLEADGYLETFSREKKQDEEACAERIGLIGVNCIDVATCANLCAANSINCKKTAAEYRDVLGGSMIYFVQDGSYIDSSLLEARNLVLRLRTASDDEKNAYLGKTRDMVAKAASLNANPLCFHPKLGLCQHSDYGVGNLVDAAKKIGNYSSSVVGYTYTMTVDVEPILEEGLASEMNGIAIE
ncbi:hypothetical protein H0O02_04120, partial [Candidatus Micrarchaeota archaeon]|nr:hypothetical protein [Candidatus Micrarchaeota archaeon]